MAAVADEAEASGTAAEAISVDGGVIPASVAPEVFHFLGRPADILRATTACREWSSLAYAAHDSALSVCGSPPTQHTAVIDLTWRSIAISQTTYKNINDGVASGAFSWIGLPTELQEMMDIAVDVLTEAGEIQHHMMALHILGNAYAYV